MNPYLAASTTEGDIYYLRFLTVPEGTAIRAECENGDGYVYFSSSDSRPVAGRCATCNTEHIIVACPHCGLAFALVDWAFADLKSNRSIACPKSGCDAQLILFEMPRISIVGTGASSPEPWSADPREAAYLVRAASRVGESALLRLRTYHRTTGARILGAERFEVELTGLNFGTFAIVTKPESDAEATAVEVSSLPSDMQRDSVIFNLVNGLRSSLDMFAQECAVIYSPDVPEDRIDIGKVSDGTIHVPEALGTYVAAFTSADAFRYLNDLRRTMQHRRIPLYHHQDRFELAFLFSEHPPAIISPEQSHAYFPDDPLSLPGSESYCGRREVVSTLGWLIVEVREFVQKGYDLAT